METRGSTGSELALGPETYARDARVRSALNALTAATMREHYRAEGHWTRLGGIVTAEVAARVPQLNPRIKVVTITGAGHLIRFDAFMKVLRGFLGEIG